MNNKVYRVEIISKEEQGKGYKKKSSIYNKLEYFSLLLGIIGISVTQIISLFWNELPMVKTYYEERKIERIKVSQDCNYIEQILGIPMVKQKINLPGIENKKTIIGSKSIFCTKWYTLIMYFDDNETLQGYFLISNEESFSPNMFKGEKVIGNKLSKYKENSFDGFMSVISSSLITRVDGSSHYMKYYYHHLATNGCFIGIGVSSLGFHNDYERFLSLAGNQKEFIFEEFIDFDKYKEQFKKVEQCKINTVAVFIYDNSTIDVISLLKKETKDKLGITRIEHSMLNN